ncbi:helix-turn-helix domain-containing protein [Actinoplanes friuliensis]|uniref:Helix-turn-helix domain-containing protein n=1 Tax=Actinoplanes friuliensis DSM 7358 TaxID=1246995 RepID=U5VPT1_9ACTN|nr:helix-turn-helix domain-containing protein [Actinoplanes friuliensis]AGZ38817.1 helix-turn-helix domain-containing protein [Actinoplanes friuliensis DSM 7358]
MRIDSIGDLGLFVRDERRRQGLSQEELAIRSGTSRRWLSDLEGGKVTVEAGLTLKVIAALDLILEVGPAPTPEIDLDAFLDNLGGSDDH